MLTEAGIDLQGIFLNADSGFEAAVVQQICKDKEIEANVDLNPRNKEQGDVEYRYFDEELYKRRFVIERMNAWIDSFKALLIRFETLSDTCVALHFLAFIVLEEKDKVYYFLDMAITYNKTQKAFAR